MIKPTRIREIDVDMLFNMRVWLELVVRTALFCEVPRAVKVVQGGYPRGFKYYAVDSLDKNSFKRRDLIFNRSIYIFLI